MHWTGVMLLNDPCRGHYTQVRLFIFYTTRRADRGQTLPDSVSCDTLREVKPSLLEEASNLPHILRHVNTYLDTLKRLHCYRRPGFKSGTQSICDPTPSLSIRLEPCLLSTVQSVKEVRKEKLKSKSSKNPAKPSTSILSILQIKLPYK